MNPLLLAAVAAAAYAALMGDKKKPASAPQPESDFVTAFPGMQLPGGGIVPPHVIPWPPAPGQPSAPPAPPKPPAPPSAPAPSKAVLTPWAPSDFVRRPLGKNIGALTPSGAAKLRQRFLWCDEFAADSTRVLKEGENWQKTDFTFPLAKPDFMTGDPVLRRVETFLRTTPQAVLAFLPAPPALRVDPRPSQGAPMGVERQEIFSIVPIEQPFIDDPLAAVSSFFTGDANKVFPIGVEGLVVVNYAEGMANGLFRGEY
jgi:hypothetical protein